MIRITLYHDVSSSVITVESEDERSSLPRILGKFIFRLWYDITGNDWQKVIDTTALCKDIRFTVNYTR